MLVGLLGHHIAYSASPAMQNAAFKAAGLDDWSYELFDVPPEELASAVAALRLPGRAGANVTIPHKLAVISLLDACDELSTRVGAVNFIRRDGDQLIGGNTDVAGVRAALEEVGWQGGRAVIRPADLPRLAVIDLVYVAGGTPLVAAARAAGLPFADGWAVLVAQGAASFTGWTSLPAPSEAMRAALAT